MTRYKLFSYLRKMAQLRPTESEADKEYREVIRKVEEELKSLRLEKVLAGYQLDPEARKHP